MNKKITVESLNQRANRLLLDDMTKLEIKEIDNQIQIQHDSGTNIMVYNLPVNFMVSGADINDAQMYVYSELIKHYKDCGFTIRISLGNEPKLICKWVNKMNIDDLDERKQLIKDHLLKNKK